MPNPFWKMMARLPRWARGHRAAGDGTTRRAVAVRDWVPLGISGPTPLLAMYRDILGQQGIQAVMTDTGVGPGALGGVPGFGMLRVAAYDIDRARAIVGTEAGGYETSISSPAPQAPDEGERTNIRSE